MSELDFRIAWQRRDLDVERDAVSFWTAQNALPKDADIDVRLSELCAAAYLGERLVGVSTASIRMIHFLRCKLAMFRVLIAPEMRIQDIASKLAVFSRDHLEAWSRQNPEQAVMGLGAVIQSRTLVENIPEAVYPDTKLSLVGYTQEGFQMRVYWFAHARVSTYWPGDSIDVLSQKERQT